ncbi:hypothetical protein CTRI78_v000164 [Colletotrichum trifolii]|uniref:Uncharacterized protein n=1 Tax=Colletotrichum trifolii TaxID=5466 RepID=A0A4R8S1D7_COLTR|nr:hypothetical protein CTRI78_v000164 [Colletotrichum trifolii]
MDVELLRQGNGRQERKHQGRDAEDQGRLRSGQIRTPRPPNVYRSIYTVAIAPGYRRITSLGDNIRVAEDSVA